MLGYEVFKKAFLDFFSHLLKFEQEKTCDKIKDMLKMSKKQGEKNSQADDTS